LALHQTIESRWSIIVLTTHYLDEAEALCSRVAMLKQGKVVVLDSTRDLINNNTGCFGTAAIITG